MIRISTKDIEMVFVPSQVAAVKLCTDGGQAIVQIYLTNSDRSEMFIYPSLAEGRAAYKNFVSDLNHMLK